jgi:hypothetical protein
MSEHECMTMTNEQYRQILADECMTTRNLPRHSQVRGMTGQNSVRVYRSAPAEVALQIRMRGSYTMVALTCEEAAELAGRLLAVAKPAKEP